MFIGFHEVDYWVGFDIAIFGAIGAYVGARLAVKWGAWFIRIVMIIVMLAMSIDLTLSSWFNKSFVELVERLFVNIF